MAVNSTAVSGSIRFTYDNAPDLRINGINTATSPMQAMQLLNGLQRIQEPHIRGAYITVEHDLEEA